MMMRTQFPNLLIQLALLAPRAKKYLGRKLTDQFGELEKLIAMINAREMVRSDVF